MRLSSLKRLSSLVLGTMPVFGTMLVLGTMLAVPAGSAVAQNVIFDAPGLFPAKKQGMPEIRVPPSVWPRLDPGAVLCRSEDDLARLAANRSGGEGGGPADCRVINSPTPIQIIQRYGPGRTQVQVTGATQSGWTDAWLPEKAPSNVGTVSAR